MTPYAYTGKCSRRKNDALRVRRHFYDANTFPSRRKNDALRLAVEVRQPLLGKHSKTSPP